MRDLDELRALARRESPLPAARTEEILDVYFRRVPLRTQYALEQFPLDSASVLDVGCSCGTSLAHFGPGSLGLDNNPEAVTFCAALGLEVEEIDVDADFDLGGRTFDYIWVSDILEHLEAPPLQTRVLDRVLRHDPGGARAVVTDEATSGPGLVVVEDLPQTSRVPRFDFPSVRHERGVPGPAHQLVHRHVVGGHGEQLGAQRVVEGHHDRGYARRPTGSAGTLAVV